MENKKKTLLKYWLWPLLWMIIIFPVGNKMGTTNMFYLYLRKFLLALFPDMSGYTTWLVYLTIRKLFHALEYGFLAYLLFRAFRAGRPTPWMFKWSLWAASISFSYAIIDEILQTFLAGRHGSMMDVFIDLIGIIMALFVIYLISFKRRKAQFRT